MKKVEIQGEENNNVSNFDKNVSNQEKVANQKESSIPLLTFTENFINKFDYLDSSIVESILRCLKKGKTQTSAIDELCEEHEELSEQEAKTIVKAYYEQYPYLKKFEKLHLVEQIRNYIKAYYPSLKRNIITSKIEIEGENQGETELNTILFDLKLFGSKVGKGNFYDLLNSNHIASYNPVKAFFSKHEHLKPTGNIKALAESINSPTGKNVGYVELFLKRWLIGIIASIYGNYSNLFLILTGGQNTGKTQFFRRLLPEELKKYAAETKLENNEADNAMVLCENILIGDDEMSGKNKADWRKIKNLLDTHVFTIRKPYGRGMEQTKRLASFWGTLNEMEILGDPTGNRRLIPIEVISINHKAYNAINKIELWMEVYHLFKAGEPWQLSAKEIKLLNDNTHEFAYSDPVSDAIMQTFEIPLEDEPRYIEELTSSQVLQKIRHLINGHIRPEAIGIRMKKLGFKQTTRKAKGYNSTRRLYNVVYKNPNQQLEINQNQSVNSVNL